MTQRYEWTSRSPALFLYNAHSIVANTVGRIDKDIAGGNIAMQFIQTIIQSAVVESNRTIHGSNKIAQMRFCRRTIYLASLCHRGSQIVLIPSGFATQPLLANQEVNVYSYRKPELVKSLFNAFTDRSGITINLVSAKKG